VSEPVADPTRRRTRLWLAAALGLCLFPLAPRLASPLGDQLRLPVTPVDRTDEERARQWLFLQSSVPLVPPGSALTVRAEDPDTEMALFMMAIGLFPASQLLPHTYYLEAESEHAAARYLLQYRIDTPADPDTRLVARVPYGAIYERLPRP
jgi:hypothetical protein